MIFWKIKLTKPPGSEATILGGVTPDTGSVTPFRLNLISGLHL